MWKRLAHYTFPTNVRDFFSLFLKWIISGGNFGYCLIIFFKWNPMQTHKIRLSYVLIILNNRWSLMLKNSNWTFFFYLNIVEIYFHNFKALCQSQISSRNSTHLFSCIRFNCFLGIYRRISWTLKFHICWQTDPSNVLSAHPGERGNKRGEGERWGSFLESSSII